jgi:hypothetical protein
LARKSYKLLALVVEIICCTDSRINASNIAEKGTRNLYFKLLFLKGLKSNRHKIKNNIKWINLSMCGITNKFFAGNLSEGTNNP